MTHPCCAQCRQWAKWYVNVTPSHDIAERPALGLCDERGEVTTAYDTCGAFRPADHTQRPTP